MPTNNQSFKKGDRIALAISYDGSLYRGWQSQRKPNVPTVQEALEQTLSQIADQPITVQCAGRTDAGVHASHQIVHFDTPVDRNAKAWVSGGNTSLPAGISIQWVQRVDSEFHARFSATARRYRYIIYNHKVRPALLNLGVTWIKQALDVELMHQDAQHLLGERDFSSYRAMSCQSPTAMRNIHFIKVYRQGELVVIDIQANAFLHHMVRNIAGVLIAVGSGKEPVGWVKAVLDAKNRCAGGVTAKPFGLYLVDVIYPEHFGLPANSPGPYFL
jgi:tRNA pseudouridine38-40 synthase